MTESPTSTLRAAAAGDRTATAGAATHEIGDGSTQAVAVSAAVAKSVDLVFEHAHVARIQGYEGDPCGECGNLTLVRNGTCLKCVTCGATSGCS